MLLPSFSFLKKRPTTDRCCLKELDSTASATRGKVAGVREWMGIDLLTCSGLRVAEASNARCGDIKAGYGESAVLIREGKGCRSRTVEISDSLRKHLKRFLAWKADRGEPTGVDDNIFVGQRGPWTAQAIQQIVKKYLRLVGLYVPGMSAHSIRNSYAVQYYSRSGHDLWGAEAIGPCIDSDDPDLCRHNPGRDPGQCQRTLELREGDSLDAEKEDPGTGQGR